MAIIELNGVYKTYKGDFWKKSKPALENLSFKIEEGSVTGFIGPNGAGKTTTIKTILGLISPDRGESFIKGVSSKKPTARTGIGFVSEQPYFYRHLSVYESLRFSAKLKSISTTALSKMIKTSLEKVELEDVLNKKIFNLSKGMQQRVNMAQALLGNPDIYIFDEPMSGLDPLGRLLFRNIISDLGKQGKTLFFSTHILDDIENICSNIIVLSKGKKEFRRLNLLEDKRCCLNLLSKFSERVNQISKNVL